MLYKIKKSNLIMILLLNFCVFFSTTKSLCKKYLPYKPLKSKYLTNDEAISLIAGIFIFILLCYFVEPTNKNNQESEDYNKKGKGRSKQKVFYKETVVAVATVPKGPKKTNDDPIKKAENIYKKICDEQGTDESFEEFLKQNAKLIKYL